MTTSAKSTNLPLPTGWSETVKTALLQVSALARVAILDVRAGFATGPKDAKTAARIAALETEVGQLREELRIKDARMARLDPRKRPHFAADDRLAILLLRAARGWTTIETARRFLLTAATVSDWFGRRDEGGDDALVRTSDPVNRFPDYVREVVRSIRASFPALGTKRIAQLLARMGLHLAEATVRRMAADKTGDAPQGGAPDTPAEGGAATTKPPSAPAPRAPNARVTAKHPYHVWHVDLTFVPTCVGLWVPWLPFALPMRWPFGWWIGAVLDHHTRTIVHATVWHSVPNATQVVDLLRAAVTASGRAPKHIVSDQGVQFRDEYREWCRSLNVRPRFGAVHQHGSIAIIERFWRSMKDDCFRRIPVPLALAAMTCELAAYLDWYHDHRPHQALGGLTPAERKSAERPARDKRRLEPRPNMPIASSRPVRMKPRRVKGTLQLCVVEQLGAAKLPVLDLRQAA
ncbi:MAG: DDE-type integrase/transposase/recombinase [Myxococcales bacterium]|nr:DDE-type integrase/transposase/recombinase [Myxococcales bacterium]